MVVDFKDFDQTRDFSGKAVRSLCYAPFVSLYFTSLGNALVCCHNWKHPVGNILTDTIDEIWHGARIKALRNTLGDYRFASGCEFCEFQTSEGCFDNTVIRTFDAFEVSAEEPLWPQQMEFSITNVCNLECIMCRGIHSSAIRSRREKLAPLPRVYSDDFLLSLRKYFPHLKRAKFLGGEPFLMEEYFRIWEIMISDSLKIPCHITTNGTQYNSRIEHVLDNLPMSFAVSLDGVSRKTIESIRVNAKFEVLFENLLRFRDYTRAKETSLALTFCLMRQNWEEFADFCLFADSLGCPVWVNTVLNPPEFGIYTLPQIELRRILDVMETQAVQLASRLRKNRAVWFTELERIRRKCGAAS